MNVGKQFRPDHPLLPNYKYAPIGYHGRASSLRTSDCGEWIVLKIKIGPAIKSGRSHGRVSSRRGMFEQDAGCQDVPAIRHHWRSDFHGGRQFPGGRGDLESGVLLGAEFGLRRRSIGRQPIADLFRRPFGQAVAFLRPEASACRRRRASLRSGRATDLRPNRAGVVPPLLHESPTRRGRRSVPKRARPRGRPGPEYALSSQAAEGRTEPWSHRAAARAGPFEVGARRSNTIRKRSSTPSQKSGPRPRPAESRPPPRPELS